MPKFLVQATKLVTHTGVTEIEADNQQDAEEKAEQLETTEFDWLESEYVDFSLKITGVIPAPPKDI